MEEEYVQMVPNISPPKKHRLMALLGFMSSLIKLTTCLYLRTLQLQEKNLKLSFSSSQTGGDSLWENVIFAARTERI
jgi:hypothetical protein